MPIQIKEYWRENPAEGIVYLYVTMTTVAVAMTTLGYAGPVEAVAPESVELARILAGVGAIVLLGGDAGIGPFSNE